ncbi:MAG TPA: lamin tail domain-containing protein [Chloroflexota bacterium]|nr:lamin tail domain-containing protein [Chloroflexota bacterium]
MGRVCCLALALVVLLAGCRGLAGSAGAPTAVPKLASSARVTESGIPKIVIDRACSNLGDASDEYVCVSSQDPSATDMSSWVLRNVLGRSFNFPTGFKLEPGQTVKVHTAAGADAATDLHWGYRVNPAWEKSDKLTLSNNENVEVFVSEPTR